MGRKSVLARLSALLVASAIVLHAPLAHAASSAGLEGVIRDDRQQPLAEVRLLVAHRDSGLTSRSEPTTRDGGFSLTGLAAGRYDLAVESEAGLYIVPQPVDLVADVQRHVQISVSPGAVPATPPLERGADSLWNNPLTAGAIVLGAAILVGVLVKDLTDDELQATPN